MLSAFLLSICSYTQASLILKVFSFIFMFWENVLYSGEKLRSTVDFFWKIFFFISWEISCSYELAISGLENFFEESCVLRCRCIRNYVDHINIQATRSLGN